MDCLLLEGRGPVAHDGLAVYPAEVVSAAGRGDEAGLAATIQPMAGNYTAEADSAVFRPRFPFVPGAAYTMIIPRAADGPLLLTVRYPPRPATPVTEVIEIWPTVGELPRNQLRLYVEFSQPMSEGFAQANVTVVDVANGKTLDDALLPMEPELWDRDRRRLTVLFDPGRIKRGLEPHAEAGYPLEAGMVIDVLLAESFLDGQGRRLLHAGRRRYRVGPDLRGRVEPDAWVVDPPRAGTYDSLRVAFGRPLDHALLRRCPGVGRGGPTSSKSAPCARRRKNREISPPPPRGPGTASTPPRPRTQNAARATRGSAPAPRPRGGKKPPPRPGLAARPSSSLVDERVAGRPRMRSPIWLRLISEVPPAIDMPRCMSTMLLLMPAAPSMNAASGPFSSVRMATTRDRARTRRAW